MGQKISLVEVLFPFPREWEGPQNKFKPKENNNNNNKKLKTRQNKYFVKMLWHRLYADREPFLFFWMLQWCGNREQKCFWATRNNRKWKYLFSFQYTSTLTNFTKCLYSHHERRFPWKFGQNHFPRIKQSPLPVEWNAQTLGFVPGFASVPHCGLNRTRVKMEFYQKNQAEFHFEARWTTRSGWWVAGRGGVVILFWKGKPPKWIDVAAS